MEPPLPLRRHLYIARNSNITNVLLTGGDPLMMSARRLATSTTGCGHSHVRIIRIGSKIPAIDRIAC